MSSITQLSATTLDELGVLLFQSAVDHLAWLDVERGELVTGLVVEHALTDSRRYLWVPVGSESDRIGVLGAFAETITDPDVRERVHDAIYATMYGPGAFRRVRDVLYECGLVDLWHDHVAQVKRGTAREWLNRRGVTFAEDAERAR